MTRLAALALLVATIGGTAAPVNTGRPAIVGTLRAGSRLTASPGTWSASGPVTFAYQWSRCDENGAHCSSIHGATSSSYTQVRGDVGRTLAVTVRASAGGGAAVAYAPLAGLVAPPSPAVAAVAQPALAGEAIVGRSLSVSAVRWTAIAPIATYRWLRCNANGRLCSPIAGATADAYVLTASDAGRTIAAVVTAGKSSVLSLTSGIVRAAPGPIPLAAPTVTGTLQQARKLSAGSGIWASSGTLSYAYQWFRCDSAGAHCATIRGATGNAYTQVAADVAHTIGLTVRASDTTGAAPAYASLAGPVATSAAKLVAQAQPRLTGVRGVGQALTVDGGDYTLKPTGFAYRWLRCNVNGRLCSPIGGATAATYTTTSDDGGHTIVAAVTVSAGGVRQVALTTAASIP